MLRGNPVIFTGCGENPMITISLGQVRFGQVRFVLVYGLDFGSVLVRLGLSQVWFWIWAGFIFLYLFIQNDSKLFELSSTPLIPMCAARPSEHLRKLWHVARHSVNCCKSMSGPEESGEGQVGQSPLHILLHTHQLLG